MGCWGDTVWVCSMMTRFEMAKVIGLRSLQLSEGAVPQVTVEGDALKMDFTYVAARELYERQLDCKVRRPDGEVMHVNDCALPDSLRVLLDTKDGQCRLTTCASPGRPLPTRR